MVASQFLLQLAHIGLEFPDALITAKAVKASPPPSHPQAVIIDLETGMQDYF